MAKRPVSKKRSAAKKVSPAPVARKKKAKIPTLGGSLMGLGGSGASGMMP